MAFVEEQKLGTVWMKLMYIIAGSAALLIPGLSMFKTPENNFIYFMIGFFFFLLAIYLLVFESKAQVRIDTQGIHYKYWPIVWNWRLISWREIENLDIKNVNPINDFGGWGYRFGRKGSGIILNSDKALYITRKTGKPFVITTSKPEAMRAEIEHRNAEIFV